MVTVTTPGPIEELTEAEARLLIDERTRRYLRVDVDEFVRQWQAGMYGDYDDNPDAIEIAMLLPMIGIDPWSNGRAA